MKNKLFLISLFILAFFNTHAQIITTISGTGIAGFSGDNGAAATAELAGPDGICFDATGNLYIADCGNHRVRKINPSGTITTIAGTGVPLDNGDGGPATAAELNYPIDVTMDAIGNLYIADMVNNRIRKIDALGIINTIAGDGFGSYNGDGIPATNAEINMPTGVAVDNAGNIYIADGLNNRIRMINTSGIITTIAGNGMAGNSGDGGPATAAKLNRPYNVRVDNVGYIYISDFNKIREFTVGGTINTVAGFDTAGYNGDNIAATNAKLDGPRGIGLDDSGNLYIADSYNYRLRKVDNSGIITTIAGTGTAGYNCDGCQAITSELYNPGAIAVDALGNIYIGDTYNNRIRFIGSILSVFSTNKPASNLKIYPNPNHGQFIINVSSNADEQVKIRVTDVLGTLIKEINTATNSPTGIDIDASTGIYFVTATTNNGTWNDKILIN